jgi:23S rRNA (pseudouridine1915-N3)-methyltransferase
MKIHIVTIGEPKLAYAKAGWEEYIARLRHYHTVKITHISDKNNNDAHILEASQSGTNPYVVALTINGPQLTSQLLAKFMDDKTNQARELCLLIGGPDGLSETVIAKADRCLGLSALTFPHDLAMVVLAEALYRASTLNSGHPYHR